MAERETSISFKDFPLPGPAFAPFGNLNENTMTTMMNVLRFLIFCDDCFQRRRGCVSSVQLIVVLL